jgi:alginate O-acetyltransferase complex protein AlgI
MDLIFFYLSAFALITTGYFLPFLKQKTIARALAWTICIVTVIFSIQITLNDHPLLRMVVIVTLQLLSMKIIVMIESYTGENRLNFIQWLAFALGWFGMRPVLFEKLISAPLNFLNLVVTGVSRIVIGFALLVGSICIERWGIGFFLPELAMMVGLSLVLHFGILNLSAAFWRLLGVDVRELFRAPYKARSLKEFWGKRWNIAFSEMTALIVYRPLKKFGTTQAMIAAFLMSGILHEIAISFPVNSGYGLPLVYFIIHGVLLYAEEKSLFVKRMLTYKAVAHLWVLGWLVLPMPLLFHTGFIENVVKPLREIMVGSWFVI